jgi:hypothetical protein
VSLPSRWLALAVCLGVAGCSGSEPKTYSAQEVRDVLQAHSFKVEITCGSSARPVKSESCFGGQGGTVLRLLDLFSGGDLELEGVRDVIGEFSSRNLGVTAWILDSESRAKSWQRGWGRPNRFVARLQKGNVVVLAPKADKPQAAAALEELD